MDMKTFLNDHGKETELFIWEYMEETQNLHPHLEIGWKDLSFFPIFRDEE